MCVYADGYDEECNSNQLRKRLLPIGRKDMIAKQIDYILVSQRWLSCVEQSKACWWGPSIHRYRFGPTDHACSSHQMHLEMARPSESGKTNSKPGPDWGALRKDLLDSEEVNTVTSSTTDESASEPTVRDKFDTALTKTIQDQQLHNDPGNIVDDAVATSLPPSSADV